MEYELKNQVLTVGLGSLGGALTSIRDMDGVEYLWQGNAAYWSGQAPVLFPICGSLRGDRAQTESGRILRMPRHGIVRKREFTCTEQSPDRIVFQIESDRSMEEQFPWHFCLEIGYRLEGNRITTEYVVKNLDQEVMPFSIGGHPGFNCPLYPQETYGDYRLVFDQEETCTVPWPVTETGLIDMGRRTSFLKGQKELRLDPDLFARDAVVLDQLCSRSVTLCTENHKKGIRLDFPDFPYLILWSSANRGPFLAMEPWMGLSTCSDEGDLFEEKRNIQKAAPGETRRYGFTITVLT